MSENRAIYDVEQPSRRPMASFIPEPPAETPAGFSLPLSSAELTALNLFRRLAPREQAAVVVLLETLNEGEP